MLSLNRKSCSSDEAPKVDIIGKHVDIEIRFADAIVDANNEQNRAENGPFGEIAVNRNSGRLFLTNTDSLREAD
ncbi:unnamed protein product [Dibothriocephalus latus]|uniref:Uncharacterized protein n=1 Tax=Dibothriocephalus latus TaxID=60516 RepID=A0A3P7M057_DIBLA|nr:unnamed protein product [Dibothriocephalus latus]